MDLLITSTDLLGSAARLQRIVPDARLVDGSATAPYAGHRASYDHDHVLADLRDRFDVVLDALERAGELVTVPTPEETLRIKAFLIIARNQVRDYLDVAARSDRFGFGWSARVLAGIDVFYRDIVEAAVSSQLARQLADPEPKDVRTLRQLPRYKGLRGRWREWSLVTAQCQELSRRMVTEDFS